MTGNSIHIIRGSVSDLSAKADSPETDMGNKPLHIPKKGVCVLKSWHIHRPDETIARLNPRSDIESRKIATDTEYKVSKGLRLHLVLTENLFYLLYKVLNRAKCNPNRIRSYACAATLL